MKIGEEKELFLQGLQKKNDEIETLKIEASLHIQDLQKEWEQKQQELTNQKERLEEELKTLEHKISEEHHFWEQQIQSKDDEMIRFRKDIANRMEEERILREKGLEDLRAQKNDLEKKELRSKIDFIKDTVHPDICLLSSGVSYVVISSKQAQDKKFDAPNIIKKFNSLVDGSGGGRSDFAQGGCKDPSLIDQGMKQLLDFIKNQ